MRRVILYVRLMKEQALLAFGYTGSVVGQKWLVNLDTNGETLLPNKEINFHPGVAKLFYSSNFGYFIFTGALKLYSYGNIATYFGIELIFIIGVIGVITFMRMKDGVLN